MWVLSDWLTADPVISLTRLERPACCHDNRSSRLHHRSRPFTGRISQHALEHVCCRHKGWGFPEESVYGSFPPSQSKRSDGRVTSWLSGDTSTGGAGGVQRTRQSFQSPAAATRRRTTFPSLTHSERGEAGGEEEEEERNRKRRRKGRERGVEGGISRKIGGGEEEHSREGGGEEKREWITWRRRRR